MKKLFLILLTVLTFSCVKVEKDIPFIIVNNLPIIEAELNGVTAKFLIDSGAAISVLDLNSMYIYGYGIDMSKPIGFVNGVGGQEKTYTLKNIKFKRNENDTTNFNFKGLNLRTFREDFGIVGILGSDYLLKNDLSIDYEKSVIRKRK